MDLARMLVWGMLLTSSSPVLRETVGGDTDIVQGSIISVLTSHTTSWSRSNTFPKASTYRSIRSIPFGGCTPRR